MNTGSVTDDSLTRKVLLDTSEGIVIVEPHDAPSYVVACGDVDECLEVVSRESEGRRARVTMLVKKSGSWKVAGKWSVALSGVKRVKP